MTPRQCRFVLEYLRDTNGARAAVRAGYGRRRSRQTAWRLMRDPAVRAALAAEMAARAARTGITPERVLDEFVRIAFAEIAHFAAWDERGAVLKDWRALSDDEAAAIAALATDGAGQVSIRLHDKGAALAALARRLGLLRPERRLPVAAWAASAKLRARLAARLAAAAAPPPPPA